MVRLSSLIVFLFMLTNSSVSLASIVTISQKPGRADNGAFGKLGANWEQKTGNTEKLALGGFFNGGYILDQNSFLWLATIEEEKSLGVVTSESSLLHLRHRYAFTDWLDSEMFVQQARNPFNRLKRRRLAGVGTRFSLQKAAETGLSLYFGLALMREHEVLESAGEDAETTTDDGIYETRASSYLFLTYDWGEGRTFNQTVYYQPLADYAKNFRSISQTSITLPLTKTISFELSYQFSRDSYPPEGVEPTDSQFKNSITLEL
ncbi:MAG: DUF481 domain-containing protein [Pseudobacteriovorax sp.]|nr:DUF481 domain-containing protein [Pseudobacteriovorax sp.]